MKRKTLNLSISFIIGLISIAFAQTKSGIITYKGEINEKYVDSFLTDIKKKDMPMNVKQGVIDMYQNASPEEFQLVFKDTESYYTYNPALEIEGGYNLGSKAGKNPYYTNNETNTILEISSSLGNIQHKPLDWKITKETRKIGKYNCYKAIATERLYSRRGYYYNRKVIAWFTPEIPLNFGPKHYKGLPGLILRIERDKFTLTATKLNFNPDKNDIKINRLDESDIIITKEEAYRRIDELMNDRKKASSQ